jgi:hypothetical protein
MNKLLMILLSIGVLLSCSKGYDNKNSDLIGKWKLVEVLADPGDGSGTFHGVISEKFIEFKSDGTVTSNGSICNMSVESVSSSSGTYSLSDSTILPTKCPIIPLKIKFHKNGSTLTIFYPCDEACIAKYIKN